MTITWEEPPAVEPGKRGREIKYLDVAEELREHEGEWALISENAWASMANQIKSGGLAAFRPRGHFDARAVTIEGASTTRAKIYARFVGTPNAAEPTTTDHASMDEAAIRASERARIADALDAARDQTWTGGERKVSNFSRAAEYVRSLA